MVKKIDSDVLFRFFNTFFATMILIMVFYPLYYIFIMSFSSATAIISNQVFLWPVDFTLDGYDAILEYKLLLSSFGNTCFYTVCGTCLNVFMTVIAAYPLSRSDLYGRNFITMYFAFTMWFGGGLIPTYIMYRNLGLVDNRLVMILPGALSIWNMVITRTYFQKSIPHELLESARLDGCSDYGYLLKIVIPLSKPILAVITLYYAIGHWNSFFNAMIYINTPSKYPLQLVLRDVLITGTSVLNTSGGNLSAEEIQARENLAQMLKYSVIVVGSAPMLILYPFIQKYFVKGIMVGALKG